MEKGVARSLLLVSMVLILTISMTKSAGKVSAQMVPPTITKNLFVPSEGCYLGAFIVNDPVVGHEKYAPYWHGNISLFEQLTGKKHASYFTYSGYGASFPIDWVNDVKAHGAVPHIAWEPNAGLDQVQNDAYLHSWAREAKKANCPIFLRFACEMNGPWVPWYTTNYAKYIEKWRIVYNVFQEERAANVVLVWSPNWPAPWIPYSYENWYPGDDYVDWVGVDFYNVHHHSDGSFDDVDPRDMLRDIYNKYSARKPIMITEWAATHVCKYEKIEVTDYCVEKMNLIYEHLQSEFPRVKMVNWFSMDARAKGESNYALTDNTEVLNNYKRVISSDYFLSTLPYRIITGITSQCNPSIIMLRENTTVTGQLFNLNSSVGMAGENVELSYSLDDVSWKALATVKTISDGNYSYTWVPPQAGVYTINASWIGDQTFDSAINTCTLNVKSNIFSFAIPIVALIAIGSVIILYAWSRHKKFKEFSPKT